MIRLSLADAPIATSLERKQDTLRHYVRMVANGQAHALFCFGASGGGKSTVVTETLLERGIQPIVLNSHLTALGLFQTLWQYRTNEILLIEDCEQSLASPAVQGLLRSALSGVGDQRTVTYTTSVKLEMPVSFTFESRVIICANSIPKGEAFRALLSRCLVYHLELTNDEVLEQFHLIAQRGFRCPSGHHLPADVCLAVVDYVSGNANRRLNMRLLIPIFRTVQYAMQANVSWEPLVKNQLQELLPQPNVVEPVRSRRQELRCLKQAIQRHPKSVKDQIRHFVSESGRSRATYFRLKKGLGG